MAKRRRSASPEQAPNPLAEKAKVIGTFNRTFALAEVAEHRIAAAKLRWPTAGRAGHLDGAFLALRPTEGVALASGEKLYALHCDELLGRVAARQDLAPGTDAEVAAMLSLTSLKAPLNRAGQVLYEQLFVKLFGSLPDGSEPTSEEWQGQADELLDEARRKLSQGWRGKVRPWERAAG